MRNYWVLTILILTTFFSQTSAAFNNNANYNDSLSKGKVRVSVKNIDEGGRSLSNLTLSPSDTVFFCRGKSSSVTVNGYNGSPHFQWKKSSTLNGSYSDIGGDNNTYNVSSAGYYFCEVTNGSGSSSTTTNSDTILAVEIYINATPNPAAICSFSPVTINVTGAPSGYNYNWSPSSGLSSTSGSSVTASTQGTYIVKDTKKFCSDTVSVIARTNPSASFTYSPNDGCGRNSDEYNGYGHEHHEREITFHASTNGLTYSWNFGDPNSGSNNTLSGSSNNSQNPKHNFVGTGGSTQSQSFTITLTVTDSYGCSSTTTQIIGLGAVPDATLSGLSIDSLNSFCDLATNTLTVSDASTTYATNTLNTINWGDGNITNITGTGTQFPDQTHTYSNTGYYWITFTVTAPGGCKDSSKYQVYFGSNPAVGLSTPGSTVGLCLPFTRTFVIDTAITNDNPYGTIYYVIYNDGSSTQTFTHPPPRTFTHTFTTSSCGATGGFYNNTFFVRIVAENPCGNSDAYVSPITTVIAPDANFTISPDTIVCKNTPLTFTNTSVAGSGAVSSGSGASITYNCTNTNLLYWNISAITGVTNAWTVTGTLGSGSTTGSQQIIVNFSQPGTYSIRLIIKNTANSASLCSSDTIIKTVCIQDIPVPSFTANINNGCVPFPVSFTNTSTPTTYCGATTRVWTITKTSSSCTPDSTNDYQFISGTDATSVNPVIQFNNEGTYSVTLSLTNKCGTFTTAPTIITAKTKPQFSINQPADICAGGTISPSANILACSGTISAYAWSFIGGTPTSSTVASPGAITYSNQGSYNIALAVTNECGTKNDTKSFLVKPYPAMTTPPNILGCANTASGVVNFTGTLNSVVNTNVVFNWTNSNPAIGLPASGTGNIGSFTLTNSGPTQISGTITVTPVLNGCSGPSITFTITVKPLPPVAVNSPTVCSGTTVTLTASGANTYVWSPVTGLSSSTGSTVTATVGGSNLSYTVTGTNTTTGCVNSAVSTITVKPTPAITATTTNPTSCGSSSGSITLAGLIASTAYTVTYTFNGGTPVVQTLSSTTSGTIPLTNLAAGTYTNISVTLNGCISNILGPIVLSDPPLPILTGVSSNSPICSGNTLNLYAGTTSTLGPLTWSWIGPNSFTSNLQNPSITNSTTAATGLYTVTLTVVNCVSTATVNVVVNETPATPTASSNSPQCSDSTIKLTASTTSTMPVTWSWTGPNGYTSTLQNPTIANSTVAMGGIYTVFATATTGSCQSGSASTTVVINPTPKITTVTFTNPTTCGGTDGTITINGLTANTSYTVKYKKNGTLVTVLLTSNASGSIVISGLSAGVYTDIFVLTTIGCPSNTMAGPYTLVDPSKPAAPTVSSNSPVCTGGTLNLTASTSSTGTASWTWSGPNGVSFTTQNPTISNITLAGAGVYQVYVTIANCQSLTGQTTVVVNQTPVTPTASSNSPLCSDSTIKLTASTTSTMPVTWLWSGPGGYTSTLQNPTIANSTSAMAGIYSVTATATTGNCASASGSTTVVINPTPKITSSSSTNPTACNSATGSIIINGLSANTTYTVYYKKNGVLFTVSLSTNGTGSLTIPSLTSGLYSNIYVVSPSPASCPSNSVGPFSLSDPNPPATPVITSNGPICSGNTLSLSATTTTSGTASWSWAGPNGFTSTLQTPSIPNAVAAASGAYSVSVTINSCVSAAGTTTVTVNQTPITPVITANSPICTDSTLSLSATTASTIPVTWSWTGPNSFTSTLQSPSITNITAAAGGVYNVIATATTGNCPSAIGTTTVTVYPTPKITSITKINPNACNTATGSITLSGLTAGQTYVVKYLKNGVQQSVSLTADGAGSVTITGLTSGSYTNIYVISSSGCPSMPAASQTLTDPNPPATPTAGSNTPICSGNALNLNASTTTIGTATWSWTGPGGYTSSLQNPSITNASVSNAGTYTVTVTIANCVSAPTTTSVVVNQTPVTPTANSNGPICSDSTLYLTASTTSTMPVTWSWTGPNSFGSSLQNPSISSATTAANGSYSVIATATTGNCPSSPGSITVTVNLTPKITSFSSTNPTACNSATGSIIINGLTANTTYTVYYKKNGVLVTATLSTNGSGVLTIPSLTSGLYSNIYVVSPSPANCPSNSVGPVTLTDPNPPATPTLTSNTPLCSGNTLNLTSTTTTSGTATWSWNGPNSFTSTLQNPSISNITTAATGTYSVTVTIANCISSPGTTSVLVNQTPVTPVVASNSPLCSDSAIKLTASTTSTMAVTWAWTGPLSYTSTLQNPILANSTIGMAGAYTVVATATTGSCPSAPASTTVVVNPTPVISSVVPTNPNACSSSTGSLLLSGLTPGVVYIVNYTKNGTPISISLTASGTGTVTIPNLTAGIYDNINVVTPQSCPSSKKGPYTLVDPNPPITPVATSNTPVCSGNTLTLGATTASSGTATWSWTGPGGYASSSQNPTIPNVTTASTGTYFVTVTIANCVSPSGQVAVVINQTPVTPVVTSNSPLCSDSTIKLTASTTSTMVVTWLWTGPNSYSSALQNPTISNATTAMSGNYNVTATATYGLLNCPSSIAFTSVIVNLTPKLDSAKGFNPTACNSASGSIKLYGLTPGVSYTVKYTKNSLVVTLSLTANGLGELIISNLLAGTYSNISVTSTAGCLSNTVGPIALVDPSPPSTPTVSSNGPICSTNTLNLLASTTSGGTATWLWTGPNGFSSSLQNPSILNTITAASGTYSVTVTITSCVSSPATIVVVVDSTPVKPVVTANTPICSDSTLYLGATTTSTMPVTWAWTGPNSFTSSSQNPSIPNVTMLANGTYSVIATAITGNCPSLAGTKAVVVNLTPKLDSIKGFNPTLCNSATGSIKLFGLTAGATYTVKYTKNGVPVTVSLSADGTGVIVIASLTAGTYANFYVISGSGCPSNTLGPITLVDPSPPSTPTLTSNSPICSGGTINLTATTTTSGTPTWSWTGPNSFVSSSQNPSISNAITAAGGTYSVTVTIVACTSAPGTITVVVDSTPVKPVITANTPLCSDSTLYLGATTTSTMPVNWSWTGPNGFSSFIQNPSIPNVTMLANGNYFVIATAITGNCPSIAGTKSVVVNLTPKLDSIKGFNPTACNSATGSIKLYGLTAGATYTVHYKKDGNPVTVTLPADGAGVITIPNLYAGIYSEIYVVSNAGCPSNTLGPITLVDPSPPSTPTLTSNSPVCSSGTLNLTANTVTPGVATWSWSGPNGFSSSLQNPTITNALTAASGTYSVTVTIVACTSAAGTINVIVDSTPVRPVITANTPICTDSTLTLGATTTSTMPVNWSWTGPNGFTSAQQNPSIPNVTLAVAGLYSVIATAVSSNCPSLLGTKTVVVNLTPVITDYSYTNPTLCNSYTGTITLKGLIAGASYNVTYLKDVTLVNILLVADAAGYVTIPNLSAGTYSNIFVTTTAGCPSNMVGPITLTDPSPPATPTLTSNSPICSGGSLQMTASTVTPGTATWLWSGPNNFVSTDQNPTINNAITAASGQYSVTVTILACLSQPGTINVIVDSTPVKPIITANTPICTDSTLTLGATTLSTMPVSWSWTGPNGFVSSLQYPNIPSVTLAAAGQYSVIATAISSNCPSATGTKTVVVNLTPLITDASFSNPTNCNSATGFIKLEGLIPGDVYTVHFQFNGAANFITATADGAGVVTIPNLLAGLYENIYVVSTADCPSNAKGPFTLKDPDPPAAPVLTTNSPVCSNTTLSFTATTSTPGVATWLWTGPNSFISTDQNPTIPNVITAASGTYTATVTILSCKSDPSTIQVIVDSTPVMPVISANTPICTDSTLYLGATTLSTMPVSWSWIGPAGFVSSLQNTSISSVTLVNAGTYAVVATSISSGCESDTGKKVVIVNLTPVITNATYSNPINCSTPTGYIELEGLIPGNVYTVHFIYNGNPVQTTDTADASGVVTVDSLYAGNYENIYVDSDADCPSNTMVGPYVLVDPDPPATPVALTNSPVCSGTTLELSATTTTPGIATWSWTGPNNFTSTDQNPSITNVLMAANGQYSVTVTILNCLSQPGTVIATVDSTPAKPTIASNSPICTDSTLIISATSATLVPMIWTWIGPNGFSSSNQSIIIPNVHLSDSGLYTVTATDLANGCVSLSTSQYVVVHETPHITNGFYTNPVVCSTPTGTMLFFGLYPNTTYIAVYTRDGINTYNVLLISDAQGHVTVPNLLAGTYTNIHLVTTEGCSSNIMGPYILVDPNPPPAPTAFSNAPLCSGGTLQLNANSTAVGNVIYTWSGPAFSSTQQNPTIPNATIAATGTYTVTVTVDFCQSAPATINVVIEPSPARPVITTNAPLCEGGTLALSATTSTTNPVRWEWYGPDGFVSNVQAPTITNVTSLNAGQYSAIAILNSNNCPSDTGRKNVFINLNPTIGMISLTSPIVCNTATGSIVIGGLTPGSVYTLYYEKNGGIPTVITIIADASGQITISNLTVGTYENIYVVTNEGCTSNNLSGPFVLSNPNPPIPPVVTSNAPICSGEDLNLSASTSSTGNAFYSWTGPNGFVSTQQNPIITNVTTAADGNYYVFATINGCASTPTQLYVQVNPTPVKPLIAASSPICEGGDLTLTATTTTPGNVSWLWIGPNSFNSTLQNPTLTGITIANSGVYAVVASINGCVSDTAKKTIVVNLNPTIAYVGLTNPLTCNTATGSIIISGLNPGSVYTIHYERNGVPAIVSLVADATGQITITNLTAGMYENIYVVTLNGCSSNSLDGPYVLSDPNPPMIPTVTSNAPICAGGTLNLSANSSAVGTVFYSWTGPNGFTSSVQNPSISNVQVVANGQYNVTVTINGCTSPPGNVFVVVDTAPSKPLITSNAPVCSDSTLTISASTSSTVPVTWSWTGPSGFTSTFQNIVIPNAQVSSSGVYTVIATSSTNNCPSPSNTINAIVNPTPDVTANPMMQTICSKSNLNIALSSTSSGVTYDWVISSNPNITGASNGSGSSIVQTLNNISNSVQYLDYTITPSNYNYSPACPGLPITVRVTINPTPVIQVPPILICSGGPFYVAPSNNPPNTIVPQGTTYTWSVDPNPNVTGQSNQTTPVLDITQVLTNHSNVNQNVVYHVTPVSGVSGNCVGQTFTIIVTVKPDPFIQLNYSLAPLSDSGCAPHQIEIRNLSLGGGLTTYDWDFGDPTNPAHYISNIDTEIIRHTYPAEGNYTITIHANNSCSDTVDTKEIVVLLSPTPNFQVNNNGVCVGQTVQFTNQSINATSYTWNFGDNTYSSDLSPSHFYTQPGNYTVTLSAILTHPNGTACDINIAYPVTILDTLPGTFSMSATVGNCTPFNVTLINHSLPSSQTLWDFGDGTNGSGDSVTHTFYTTGTFQIHMTAIDPNGCKFDTTKSIIIGGPAGNLVIPTTPVCGVKPIRLDAVVYFTDSIYWDFGDGTYAVTTAPTVNHIYPHAGYFIPKAVLMSGPNASCRVNIPGIDTIKIDSVKAGFEYTTQNICDSTKAIFNDTTFAYSGVQNIQWVDYGDATSGSGDLSVHYYHSTGNYDLEEIVTSVWGCQDTVNTTVPITVRYTPNAAISSVSTTCMYDTINIASNITSVDSVNYIYWQTSNGVTSNDSSFQILFSQTGSVLVTLVSGTIYGCFDTTSTSIVVNPLPSISASANTRICNGDAAILTASSSAGNYLWGPLVGLSCYTCDTVIAAPTENTTYVVSTVNSFNCRNTDTIFVTVIQPFTLTISPKDTICVGQSIVLSAGGATNYTWTPSSTLSCSDCANPIATPEYTTQYFVIGYDDYNCFSYKDSIQIAVGQYPVVTIDPIPPLSTGTLYPITSVITNGPIRDYHWYPPTNLDCDDCEIPKADIKKDICYVLKAENIYGCSGSDTICIKAFCENVQTFLPNAFTPDHDGINDVFMVRAKGINTVKSFKVYNRWGQLVFERSNFPPNNPAFGWDGTIKGSLATPDVFAYTAEVICENNVSYVYKGNVTLIR